MVWPALERTIGWMVSTRVHVRGVFSASQEFLMQEAREQFKGQAHSYYSSLQRELPYSLWKDLSDLRTS
jgi:hypothetical protein